VKVGRFRAETSFGYPDGVWERKDSGPSSFGQPDGDEVSGISRERPAGNRGAVYRETRDVSGVARERHAGNRAAVFREARDEVAAWGTERRRRFRAPEKVEGRLENSSRRAVLETVLSGFTRETRWGRARPASAKAKVGRANVASGRHPVSGCSPCEVRA